MKGVPIADFSQFDLQAMAEPETASIYFSKLALLYQPLVLPTRQSKYVKQVGALRRASLGKLRRQRQKQGLSAMHRERASGTAYVVADYIVDLRKVVSNNLNDSTLAGNQLRQEYARWELLERRTALQHPSDQEDYEEALRFMVGRGEQKDLDLIREQRHKPKFASETINQLIEWADDFICKRVYDPIRVAQEGEEAYLHNRGNWDRLYHEQYIAVHRGVIEDACSDRQLLIKRLAEKQRTWGPFRAYIIQIGAPILVLQLAVGIEGVQTSYILDETTGKKMSGLLSP